MSKLIVVAMADWKIARGPDCLTTLGLGSCVGINLYDLHTHIGGMAHVMLPTCTINSDSSNKAKYADTAIEEMLKQMVAMGAKRAGIIAKLAGGAHMFNKTIRQDVIKVGQRNAEVSKEVLKKLGIPIRAEDLGGTFGRTIILDPSNGSLKIKTIGHGEKII